MVPFEVLPVTDDFLALTLDEETVLLHPDRTQLIVLDPWATRIWQHCDGCTTEDLVIRLQAPIEQIDPTLRTLARTGVVRCEKDRWTRALMRWV